MSECLVITRGGWGDVWRVSSRQDAHAHPLWQPCDTLVCEPHEILDQYNLLELPRLFRMAGGEDFERGIRSILTDEHLRQSQKRSRLEQFTQGLWDKLYEMSEPIPVDPAIIVERVREDRQALIEEAEKESRVTKEDVKTAEKKPAEKKEKAKPYPDNGVIHFGVRDKESGTKYDVGDNNPKRKGTKAHDQFSKFREGMTVEQFVKAIGNESVAYAELKWCLAKGYVELETF